MPCLATTTVLLRKAGPAAAAAAANAATSRRPSANTTPTPTRRLRTRPPAGGIPELTTVFLPGVVDVDINAAPVPPSLLSSADDILRRLAPVEEDNSLDDATAATTTAPHSRKANSEGGGGGAAAADGPPQALHPHLPPPVAYGLCITPDYTVCKTLESLCSSDLLLSHASDASAGATLLRLLSTLPGNRSAPHFADTLRDVSLCTAASLAAGCLPGSRNPEPFSLTLFNAAASACAILLRPCSDMPPAPPATAALGYTLLACYRVLQRGRGVPPEVCEAARSPRMDHPAVMEAAAVLFARDATPSTAASAPRAPPQHVALCLEVAAVACRRAVPPPLASAPISHAQAMRLTARVHGTADALAVGGGKASVVSAADAATAARLPKAKRRGRKPPAHPLLAGVWAEMYPMACRLAELCESGVVGRSPAALRRTAAVVSRAAPDRLGAVVEGLRATVAEGQPGAELLQCCAVVFSCVHAAFQVERTLALPVQEVKEALLAALGAELRQRPLPGPRLLLALRCAGDLCQLTHRCGAPLLPERAFRAVVVGLLHRCLQVPEPVNPLLRRIASALLKARALPEVAQSAVTVICIRTAGKQEPCLPQRDLGYLVSGLRACTLPIDPRLLLWFRGTAHEAWTLIPRATESQKQSLKAGLAREWRE